MSASGGVKAILAAFIANACIAVTKFVAFALTGSSSMLAESIHSVADSGNQLLLIVGGKRARRAATPQHPFGYGRERYIYAFIVAIVLFSVGGVFALYEGYHKLSHPEPITSWHWVPVTVLVIATGLEIGSFATAIRESNLVRKNTPWITFVRRARAPELPVVLLEDLAALLGLVLALLGVSLTLATGDGMWDGIGTLGIGVLLVLVAVFLAVETKSLLLGESATSSDLATIERAILDGRDVQGIISLKTMHLGPDELLVAVKVAVTPTESAQQLAAEIDRIEARIRSAIEATCVIYIEPDLRRAAPADSTPEIAHGSTG